jgi:hypothetical protein
MEAVQLVGLEDQAPRLVEPEDSAGFKASTPLIGRRLLLVLGMHRSGTSALSGLLGQVGFQAPTNPDPADVNNPTGYWEPPHIRRFHDRLIEGCQSSWEDPLLPVLPWQPEQPEAALVELEAAIAADFADCVPEAVALVKDPRQCRLMPLWNQLMERRPLVAQAVLLLRRPEAVAASLWRRDELTADRALLLWLTHTLEAERHSRALPRVVLSYEALLADPAAALRTCQRLAGLPEQAAAPDLLLQWIRPELNHGSEPADASGLAEAGELLELADAVYGVLVGPEGATAQLEVLEQAERVVRQHLLGLLNQGSRRATLQLFWETQTRGFCEKQSQRRSVAVERGRTAVVFELPESAARPCALRLDLAEQPGLIFLQLLALSNAAGLELWRWSSRRAGEVAAAEEPAPIQGVNANTAVLDRGMVVAADGDPGLLLTIPAEVLQRLDTGAQLRVEAHWQPLTSEMARTMLPPSMNL